MYMAAEKGYVECIYALLRYGADVNKARQASVEHRWWGRCSVCACVRVTAVWWCCQHGATPTFIAARKGHVECVDALARHGADGNKADIVSVETVAGARCDTVV